jgi:predicted enzyme related to lactoylglutathione lyase
VIVGVHSLIYSDDATATRAFLSDVLGWPHVEHPESGPGWLIFRSGPSEVGVHPTQGVRAGEPFQHERHHLLSMICDDLDDTMRDLAEKGASFIGDVADHGFGRNVLIAVPGADPIMLYEPSHPTAYDL